MHRLNAREHEHATTIDGCTLLNKAIKKYGHFNFLRIVIDVAYSADELNEKEIYWIAKYNTFKGEGYNCTAGGFDGNSGANSVLFKGYVLVIDAKTGAQNGVYEGANHTASKLSTNKEVFDQSHICKVLKTQKCYKGYYFVRVQESLYRTYLEGITSVVQEVADKHIAKLQKEKQEAKAKKAREEYVKKMKNRKFILASSYISSEYDKVFTTKVEVAEFLGIAESTVRYRLKTGSRSTDEYSLSYISFEQYEAFLNKQALAN